MLRNFNEISSERFVSASKKLALKEAFKIILLRDFVSKSFTINICLCVVYNLADIY